MSVILGYKEKSKIYLAADNRVTNKKDNSYSDDNKKIIVLNNHLAIVCSGSKYAQDTFENFIAEKDTGNWTIDDINYSINILCCHLNLLNDQNLNKIGMYFIIGGLNGNNQPALWSVSWNNNKVSDCNVELALYPPEDVDMQTCCDIYIRNIHEYFSEFTQKTIKEISEISKAVSLSGDIWTYDFTTDYSELVHFH